MDIGQHLVDLQPEAMRRPAEVRFKNLPHIHAAWHTKRVEHDVNRRTVLQIGHILDRIDFGNDALVTVSARHLVTRLQLALNRNKDLDHLHDARRQLVTALQLFNFAIEAGL